MSHDVFISSNLIMIKYKTFSKSIFIEIYIGEMFSGNLNCLKLIITFQKHTFIKKNWTQICRDECQQTFLIKYNDSDMDFSLQWDHCFQ